MKQIICSALVLFSTILPVEAAPAWVQLVKAAMPWGAAEYTVYYLAGDKMNVRYCGSTAISNPEEKERAADINSLCTPAPDRPEISIPLNAFKSAMLQMHLVPRPPHQAVPLTPAFLASIRKLNTPESLRQSQELAKIQRLAWIKEEIEGIGVKPVEKAAPLTMNEVMGVAGGTAQFGKQRKSLSSIRSLLADRDTYYVVRRFDQSRKSCGTGTAPPCASMADSSFTSETGVKWELAARKLAANGRLYEVWKDTSTGILWGDRLDGWYRHTDTVAVDSSGKVTTEIACVSPQGKMSGADLGQNFSLPSAKEFEVAFRNGLNRLQPYLNFNYWAEGVAGDGEIARVVDFKSFQDLNFKNTFASVRCLVRPK